MLANWFQFTEPRRRVPVSRMVIDTREKKSVGAPYVVLITDFLNASAT